MSPEISVKYPRTLHLPWSDTIGPDGDHVMVSTAVFAGREVVVTEKLDGENTTLYRTHLHARSLDSGHHPSRGWIKNYGARLGPHLPPGVRLCGENLFALHSIAYQTLPSYFLVFGVWNGDELLSWDETIEFCARLGTSQRRSRAFGARLVSRRLGRSENSRALQRQTPARFGVWADKRRLRRAFGGCDWAREVGRKRRQVCAPAPRSNRAALDEQTGGEKWNRSLKNGAFCAARAFMLTVAPGFTARETEARWDELRQFLAGARGGKLAVGSERVGLGRNSGGADSNARPPRAN